MDSCTACGSKGHTAATCFRQPGHNRLELAATLVGLQIGAAVALAITTAIELEQTLPEARASVLQIVSELWDETVEALGHG